MEEVKRAAEKARATLAAIHEGDAVRLRTMGEDGKLEVNAVGADSKTALMWAATKGDVEAAQLLLDYGAAVDQESTKGWTACGFAAQMGYRDVAQLLLARESMYDRDMQLYWQMFMSQLKEGAVTVVELFLDGVLAPDIRDLEGWLIWAAQEGHLEVVERILDRGAKVDVTGKDGWTAFMWAAHKGHAEILRVLLDRGAALDSVEDEGWTALMFAAHHGWSGVVRLLLDRGASTGPPKQDGWTALMLAALSGHTDVVELLLEHGADPTCLRKNLLASDYSNNSCKALLLNADGSSGHQAKLRLLQAQLNELYLVCEVRVSLYSSKFDLDEAVRALEQATEARDFAARDAARLARLQASREFLQSFPDALSRHKSAITFVKNLLDKFKDQVPEYCPEGLLDDDIRRKAAQEAELAPSQKLMSSMVEKMRHLLSGDRECVSESSLYALLIQVCDEAKTKVSRAVKNENSRLSRLIERTRGSIRLVLWDLKYMETTMERERQSMLNSHAEEHVRCANLARVIALGETRAKLTMQAEATYRTFQRAKTDLVRAKATVSDDHSGSLMGDKGVECDGEDCMQGLATLFCGMCDEHFCDSCFSATHKTRKKASHVSVPVKAGEAPMSSVDLFQKRVLELREEYEEVLRRMHEVREAGYPEFKCPGVSRSLQDVESIPEISREELEAHEEPWEQVGSGAFGIVYRHTMPRVGLVAFKKFHGHVEVRKMREEAAAIFKLRHPNIVHLYGVCMEPLGLVLELVDGQSLDKVVYQEPRTPLETNRAMGMLRQILFGVEFIHSRGALHLDLKAANVLLAAADRVKLADFGTAQESRATAAWLTKHSPELTLPWAAPERLVGVGTVGPACDIYAVGMIVVEMLTARAPFEGTDPLRLAQVIMKGEADASALKGVNKKCSALIRDCWSREPKKRPMASQLIGQVSTMLVRECVFGLHKASLTDGVECNAQGEPHFACIQCVEGEMGNRLKAHSLRGADTTGGFQLCKATCPAGLVSTEKLAKVNAELLSKWNRFGGEERARIAEQRSKILVKEAEERAQRALDGVSERAAHAGTKACPRCAMRWAEPVACSHVTCHPRIGRDEVGCGFEWCWHCQCDYNRVRREGNAAHERNCRLHTDNL